MFMTFLWSCVFVYLTGVSFCLFPFFWWSYDTLKKNKKNKQKTWPLCCFSLSLFRSLGLPPSPSRTPSRVWKPPRDQLHRAAECAGSPPSQPHTTWGHKIWCRKPARSKSWGTSTRVTAASKSLWHPPKKWIFINILTDMQYINIDIMVCVVIKQCNLGVTGNGENITPSLYDLCALILVNCPITPLNP